MATVAVDANHRRHTRRCNGRAVCSCSLRGDSANFHQILKRSIVRSKKRRADDRSPVAVMAKVLKHKYQKVTSIQQLDVELKVRIAAFLAPRSLGRLSMVRVGA